MPTMPAMPSPETLRNVTWNDVAVFFPKCANRVKMHWRRSRDNADLLKTLKLVEGEETRIENVFNAVDEFDWWPPEAVAKGCGDELVMPIMDASLACWGGIDKIMAPLKNRAELDKDRDLFGTLPQFHPLPPPRKLVPVPPPRKFYPSQADMELESASLVAAASWPVPPPRKKYKRANQVRNVKGGGVTSTPQISLVEEAPPRPPRRNRGRIRQKNAKGQQPT